MAGYEALANNRPLGMQWLKNGHPVGERITFHNGNILRMIDAICSMTLPSDIGSRAGFTLRIFMPDKSVRDITAGVVNGAQHS